MAGETIVFFPKYTCLVGVASPGEDYYSDPYDVTSYKTVSIEALAKAVAASATVAVQMEESSDMITWSDMGSSMALTPGTPSLADNTSPARYIRAKVTVVGADGVVTLWVKGVARDS